MNHVHTNIDQIIACNSTIQIIANLTSVTPNINLLKLSSFS